MSPAAYESRMARAFGADVQIGLPEHALFIVEGRTAVPEAAIRSVGGSIVIRPVSGLRVFATMTPTAFLALRAHPDIRFIGPVSLDIDRFNQVMGVLQK